MSHDDWPVLNLLPSLPVEVRHLGAPLSSLPEVLEGLVTRGERATMTDEELSDALDGLYAYDMGCVDSGIHDEALRERAKAALHERDVKWLSRWVRDQWLSDEAMEQGYTIEDVKQFVDWLSERMDYDL